MESTQIVKKSKAPKAKKVFVESENIETINVLELQK